VRSLGVLLDRGCVSNWLKAKSGHLLKDFMQGRKAAAIPKTNKQKRLSHFPNFSLKDLGSFLVWVVLNVELVFCVCSEMFFLEEG
jgi:hypothetical protein